MIIKYIPNALDKQSREEFDKAYKYQTVEYWLKDTVARTKEGLLCIVNGKVVEWDYVPAIGDEIIFIQDLSGGKGMSIGQMILGVILTVVGAVTQQYWLGGIGISLMVGGVMGLVSGLFANDKPGQQNNSPTYSWDGIQNTIGEGNVVPVVYGEHRVGGVVIETFVDGKTASGLQGRKYLNALMAISEGPIFGLKPETIQINNKEITQYDADVNVWHTDGSINQAPIANFSRIARHYSMLNTVKLTKAGGAYIYKTYNKVDLVTITVMSPALFATDSTGGMIANAVGFSVYRAKDVGDAPGEWEEVGSFAIMGQTKSPIEYDYQVAMPAGCDYYYIKIQRNTIDFDIFPSYNGDTYLKSVTEIEYATLSYPSTALMGVRLKATDKLSGSMPTITGIAQGRKLVDVRNLAAAPTLAGSKNPANIIYDLLTNKLYGLGTYIDPAQIHLDSFIEFANWCDELVTYKQYNPKTGLYDTLQQKRYEINLVLDTAQKANEVIAKIAGTCRGIVYWSGDQVKIVVDKPQSTYAQVFSMGNIVADSFEETYVGLRDVPNQVEVTILDETNDYKKYTLVALDKSRLDEVIPAKTINMYGITDKARARREAVFAMKRAKGIRRIIKFSSSVQALVCEVGDLFLFQHDVPQYGYGGNVVAIDGTTITLDTDVTLTAGYAHRLRIRKQNGAHAIFTVTPPLSTTTNVIDVGMEIPADVQEGDVWVFGEINREAKPFRLLSAMQKSDGTVELQAEEYNDSVFDEDENIEVKDLNYSYIGLIETADGNGANYNDPINIDPVNPPDPSAYDIPPYVLEVALTEENLLVGKNYKPTIVVNWKPVAMPENSVAHIVKYDIIYSTDGGKSWTVDGTVNASGAGFYRMINVEISKTYDSWDASDSYQLAEIVECDGKYYLSLAPDNVGHHPASSAEWWHEIVAPNKTYHVHVKPVTNYGLTNNIEISTHALDNAIQVHGDTQPPAALTGVNTTGKTFTNEITWYAPLEPDFDHVEIWCASGVNDRAQAQLVGVTKGIMFKHTALSQQNDYYYWVRPVDTAGNRGDFTPLSATAGLLCKPSNDPEMVLDLLTASISESQLASSLLASIESPESVQVVEELLKNQWTVKANSNGHVAGVGLIMYPPYNAGQTYAEGEIVEAENGLFYKSLQGDNLGNEPSASPDYWSEVPYGTRSEFIVVADKFAIINPGDGDDVKVPFVVGTVKGVSTVGVNGDLMVDGTIGANAIRTEELVVGDNIQMGPNAFITWGNLSEKPTNIGSLTGDESILNNQIVVDNYGVIHGIGSQNVIVDNSKQQWNQISGRPNTTYIDANGIYTGTLVASQIEATNFKAKTANIEDLAVTTLKIAGQAITVPTSAYSGSEIVLNSSNAVIQQVTINASGCQLFISTSYIYRGVDYGLNPIYGGIIKLYRNTTLLMSAELPLCIAYDRDGNQTMYGYYGPIAFTFTDTPPQGTYTYYVKMSSTGYAKARSMYLVETKR